VWLPAQQYKPTGQKSRRRDRLIREETQFELHTVNTNKEAGFSLSRSWKPSIHSLKETKTVLSMYIVVTP
jgi:hypothetical protein